MDACREQGVEEPVWRWDGGFVIVTFKRPTVEVSDDPSKGQVRPKQDSSTTQAGLKYDPSSPQVHKLIEIMPDGYADMKEIMALCGLKSLKRFRENYILPALADGTLERLYPNHPNHPKQKYRLTTTAREWKETNNVH